MTLTEMTAEIREVNTQLGWRDAKNTFGDYIALLHSEAAETLEAFRDYKLEDATGPDVEVLAEEEDHMGNYPILGWRPAKPEGVGSEFADLVIRLLDMCDVTGITVMDGVMTLAEVPPIPVQLIGAPDPVDTFGDMVSWLHRAIDLFWGSRDATLMLRAIVTAANRYGIDLTDEYTRKIAYNRTRPFRHGGRTL
jgi:hypothetical protein